MPADEHELYLALEDGVEFKELLAPVKLENGKLVCQVMTLGAVDESGRAGVCKTDETVELPADTVIAAVGEKVPTDFYEANGIHTDAKGRPMTDNHLQTNVEGVYVVGDGLYGPSLVVEGMRHAITAAEAIMGKSISESMGILQQPETIYAKKGILAEVKEKESERCLACSSVCENCVDVCPNRANISIKAVGMTKAQVIHVDYMCNECGNCESFCPYASAPYLDKFTLFANETDMENSKNEGFTVLDKENLRCKIRLCGDVFVWTKGEATKLSKELQMLIEAVCTDYAYLIPSLKD